MTVTLEALLKAGAHFGHQKRFWNPKFEDYLFATKNRIHIIDLRKTLQQLTAALEALKELSFRNGKILFVGTKKAAANTVREVALACQQHYISKRWLGGTLTNWKTVRQSSKKLKFLLKEKETGFLEQLSKKEALNHQRYLDKLDASLGGIVGLGGLPDALFLIDIQKERIALEEAKKIGIPVFAIVDSNCSPEGVDYLIPGNDDSASAIKLYLEAARDAILEGKKLRDDTNSLKVAPHAQPTTGDHAIEKALN